jgi:DNA topoisomerase I
MTELIICEKPSAAKKIAEALADKTPQKESINSVPVYRLTRNGKKIIVSSAVGHLYTVGEKEKSAWSHFPVYDVQWVPTYENNKAVDYAKKYLNVLKKLSKEADEFTVACDYDIEGEVIGLNVIRYVCNQKDANRMKFSTLTKNELITAYENKFKSINWGLANAGETRHILDFFFGINLTRALTNSINKVTGGFKVLSSGRVQGPALKVIVDKEKEIVAFIPKSYWEVILNGLFHDVELKAMHINGKFWEEKLADAVMQKTASEKKGKIAKNEKNQFIQNPPVPFDLTSLQIEAHRVFRIKPKQTLELAQNLYTESYISYPRTSSQKLPVALGFQKILTDLKRNQKYAPLAEKILQTKLIPNEGKKTDDAHPSIYPTGIHPENLNDYEAKLYDLIVKRFLSVFAEPAKRETNTITIDVNTEEFITKGTVTVYKGWHEFYAPYVKQEELELPPVKVGAIIDVNSIEKLSKETKPPNRYTQSSIIKDLEKKNLGTKATRASIIETLFNRSYVIGDNNIEATELGIKTIDTLEKYCPLIIDEELTRQFEDEMKLIQKSSKTEAEVLDAAKILIDKIIKSFKEKSIDIGKELSSANNEAIKEATTVGKCHNCSDGELVIRKGKFGKFIGCNNYPDCKTIFNIPHVGIIKPTKKICESCSYPIIEVKPPKKGPQEICINPKCPTKVTKDEDGNVVTEDSAGKKFDEEGMTCPNCKKGKMVLRKSFYGEFLGCDNYPKCKTMMRIIDGKVDINPLAPVAKKKSKKKAKKKATTTTSTITTKKKKSKKKKKTSSN